MRADLHIHTRLSPDSLAQPEKIIARANQRGIDVLAITDHNRLEMAREMARCFARRIIVGEEIQTRDGELIGLFLQKRVPPGLSALDTARLIHEQHGLVVLPHPFDSLRHSAIHQQILPELMPAVDVVEALNARIIHQNENHLAAALAEHYHKPAAAGSDAHLAHEVGQVYAELDCFEGPDSLLAALGQAQLHGGLSSPAVHISSFGVRVLKQMTLPAETGRARG